MKNVEIAEDGWNVAKSPDGVIVSKNQPESIEAGMSGSTHRVFVHESGHLSEQAWWVLQKVAFVSLVQELNPAGSH